MSQKLPIEVRRKFKHRRRVGVRSKVLPRMNITLLAAQSGINRPHLSLVLNGKKKPGLAVLKKLGKVLDMGLDETERWLSDNRH